MADIIPAVLAPTLAELRETLERVHAAAPLVQVDVVDGVFAPNKTWPYTDGRFERFASQEEGLPFWEELDFEIDLMVAAPERVVSQWIAAGAARIVVHQDSASAREALEALRETRGELFSAGLGIRSDASADSLAAFEGLFDYVQVMGIERVGFQRQSFDERALVLVRQLRERYPGRTIQVDGGVKLENARALVQAGASRLIVGSAIFGADDPVGALEALQKEANA